MDSWFYPHSVTPRDDIIPTMRSRLLHVGIVFVLVVCLVCPLVELLDHWDHTIQTGNDTEYTLVILALCIGAAYSFTRFIFKLCPFKSSGEVVSKACAAKLLPFAALRSCFVSPIPLSSPALALRI